MRLESLHTLYVERLRAAAQHVEHYEIAGYSTLCTFAGPWIRPAATAVGDVAQRREESRRHADRSR